MVDAERGHRSAASAPRGTSITAYGALSAAAAVVAVVFATSMTGCRALPGATPADATAGEADAAAAGPRPAAARPSGRPEPADAAIDPLPVRLDREQVERATADLAITRLTDRARFPGQPTPGDRLMQLSSRSQWSLAGRITVQQRDLGRRVRRRGPVEAGVEYQLTLEAWRPDDPDTVLVREIGTGATVWTVPEQPDQLTPAARAALRAEPQRAFTAAVRDLRTRMNTRRGEVVDHIRAWAPEYPRATDVAPPDDGGP